MADLPTLVRVHVRVRLTSARGTRKPLHTPDDSSRDARGRLETCKRLPSDISQHAERSKKDSPQDLNTHGNAAGDFLPPLPRAPASHHEGLKSSPGTTRAAQWQARGRGSDQCTTSTFHTVPEAARRVCTCIQRLIRGTLKRAPRTLAGSPPRMHNWTVTHAPSTS